MHGTLVFVHADFFYQFYECFHGKGVVLGGDAEFLLDLFLINVAFLHQAVLFHDLSCIADKFIALRCQRNSPAAADEQFHAELFF